MISKTTLAKILNESKFDPRESTGPMSIVLGMNNPNYLESKAIEMIHIAQQCVAISGNLNEYNEKITQAISLLAVAKGSRNETVTSRPKKGTRSNNSSRDKNVS